MLATATIGAARLVLSWLWLPGYPAYREQLRVLAGNGGLTLDVAPPYVVDAASTLRIARTDGGAARRDDADGRARERLRAPARGVRRRDRGPAPRRLSDAAGAAADTRAMQALVRAIAAGHGIEVGGEAGRAA